MNDLLINDIFINTSYRAKNITLEINLSKTIPGSSISNSVFFKDKEVLTFENISSEKNEKVIISKKWENPILWGPKEFNLLKLKTEVKDTSGKVIDCLETRFGFREFYPEGKYFYWNGVKVKFGAVPFLSTWGWNLTERSKRNYIRDEYIRLSKRLSAYMNRHIYDPEYRAEIADEEGIVYAQGIGGVPAGLTLQMLDSDEFWNNAINWVEEDVKSLRNHPSIITWYLSNECMGASYKKNAERLKLLGEVVLKEDNMRIIEFGCDIDLHGLSPVISTHYPVDIGGIREDRAYFPLLAYWRYFNEEFKPGMKVPAGQIKDVANVIGSSPITYGFKPIVINETCWIYQFNPPDALTKVYGEKVYESPEAVEEAHKEATKWFVYGHRDVEASVITPWEWIKRNPIQLEIPQYEINILQRYNKFYSGEKVKYDINLHRDVFYDGTIIFSWELKNERRVIISEEKEMLFGSCDFKREKIEIKMPSVKEKTGFVLSLSMEENGEKRRMINFPVYVYPKSKIELPVGAKIGIYEKNEYKRIKEILGKGEKLDNLKLDELKKFDILIIGKNEGFLIDIFKKDIGEYVKEGGKVLVLYQNKSPDFLPFKLVITTRTPAVNYTFRERHPILKNISNDELQFWYPEFKTGENYYLKPEKGNFISLVETGGVNGLVYSGLLEVPYGKGTFILSQLSLIENFKKNPVAKKFLENIINYLYFSKREFKKAGFIGLVDLESVLKKTGVKIESIYDINWIFNFETVIIDGRTNFSQEEINAIKKFVENGGKLLIHKITPSNIKFVRELTGKNVNIYSVQPPEWKGRAIKIGKEEIIEGITNFDLYWKERPVSQDYSVPFYSEKFLIAPIGESIIEADSIQEILYPSFLLKINKGNGFVILDNLNWDNLKTRKSERILSNLMTNLNVEIGFPDEVKIPENLKYVPINIKGLLNRSFKDEKEGDGKGGWTDQGEIDLRSFPTEPSIQTFWNVPFRIEKPLSCLVLSSRFQKPGLPEKVEIPLNLKADVLFFLQSSAWTSQHHHASYIVNYEDETHYEIKLIGGVNLRDWVAKNYDELFLDEVDTITKVAWTGPVKGFGQGSLYLMIWPNSYPNKKIKSITFLSKNIGVPILVGITVGVKEEIK